MTVDLKCPICGETQELPESERDGGYSNRPVRLLQWRHTARVPLMGDDWRTDPLWQGTNLASQVAYRIVLGSTAGLAIYVLLRMKGITL